jgi:hypothetical protein
VRQATGSFKRAIEQRINDCALKAGSNVCDFSGRQHRAASSDAAAFIARMRG